MSPLKMFVAIVGVIICLAVAVMSGNIWENVDADKICCIQNIVDGKLNWYTTAGMKTQKFGKVTYYPKRFLLKFEANESGDSVTGTHKIRFNDGGEGFVVGSVNIAMPLDNETLSKIHTKYGSVQALYEDLVKPVFAKAIFNSGPLMSSRESYSLKRTEIVRLIEDQAVNGVYRTESKETTGFDEMTGQKKTLTVVQIMKDDSGNPLREDISPLSEFGLKTYNLAVERIPYVKIVRDQIATQQKAVMDVQTAMAKAKEAEQRAITVAKNGEADAAKSKWEQEVVKARAIVTAQQRKEVAKLEKEAAEFEKQKQILLGQGEAERKKLVMAADGALKQKLAAWVKINGKYAEEFGKQKWTPEIEIGASNGNGNGELTGARVKELIDLMMIDTAQKLSLDTAMRGK